MARSQTTDLLNSMRYHVTALLAGDTGGDPLQPGSDGLAGRAQAGFTTCTVPEVNIEPTEYKEGIFHFPRKYPGAPTVGDVSLARGVAKNDTAFWRWARTAIDGGGEYRVDLHIKHYGRDALGPNGIDVTRAVPQRIYHAKEAFSTRCKPAGDFDATSADISLSEVDVACEDLDLVIPTA